MSVTKRLSQISIEDNYSVASVLENIPTKALIDIYAAEHAHEDLEKLKRPQAKKSIEKSIADAGAKYFISNLNLAQLKATLEPLEIDHEKRGNNPNSKVVLSKRLFEEINTAGGLAAFLKEYSEVEVLKSLVETFEIPSKAATKDALVEAVASGVESEALHIFFSSFSEDLLRDVAWDMKLEKDEQSTASRHLLVECILENKAVPPKTTKPKVKVSKNKPELKKGVKYEDVFQHYLLAELLEFAEDNKIRKTGTKKELIERILAWFDGDKENTVVGTKKVGRRKKAVSTKKAPTKKSTTKPAPKAASKPAPQKTEEVEEEAEEAEEEAEEVEEVEEVEEEAEEEAEEEQEEDALDLDHLEQYPFETLKSYCEEESLKVKGTKKADYIKAIIAYNEESEE